MHEKRVWRHSTAAPSIPMALGVAFGLKQAGRLQLDPRRRPAWRTQATPAQQQQVEDPEPAAATPSAAAAAAATAAARGRRPGGGAGSARALGRQVVQVQVVHRRPDFVAPWLNEEDLETLSSGVVVNADQGYVLTTAGAVHFAAQMRVRLGGDPQLHDATLLALAPDCDLALLQVDSPRFCKQAAAVKWAAAALPRLHSAVTVAAFPAFGDALAVTQGVLSRLEVVTYNFSGRRLLALQVDAAVNPGCWGGGLFNDAGQCLGILLQRSAQRTWEEQYFDNGDAPGPGEGGWGAEDDSDDDEDEGEDDEEDGERGRARGWRPYSCGAPSTSQADSTRILAARSAHIRRRPRGKRKAARRRQMLAKHGADGDDGDDGDDDDDGMENIAFAVPVPIINHFLADLKEGQGRYAGFPDVSLHWQEMESSAMRAFYGLRPKEGGVLVCSSWAQLQPGDVLTHVDGVPIGGDGGVVLAAGSTQEPLCFEHLLASKRVGQQVAVRVLRGGAPLALSMALPKPRAHSLLQPLGAEHSVRHGRMQAAFLKPSYLVLGPLVLVGLCRGVLDQVMGPLWADGQYFGWAKSSGRFRLLLPLLLAASKEAYPPGRPAEAGKHHQTGAGIEGAGAEPEQASSQLVVLTDVLGDGSTDSTVGSDLDNPGCPRLLTHVGDVPVSSCLHLAEVLLRSRSSGDSCARLSFADGGALAVDLAALPQQARAVQVQHQIRSMASPDLVEPCQQLLQAGK